MEYSSLRNEYIVVFQLTSPSLSTGKAVIITSRILAVSFKIATYPVLQLKANERSGGSMVDVPVTKPHVIHNPSNGTYVYMLIFSKVRSDNIFTSKHGLHRIWTRSASIMFESCISTRTLRFNPVFVRYPTFSGFNADSVNIQPSIRSVRL